MLWIVVIEVKDDVVYCYGVLGDSQMLRHDDHLDHLVILGFVDPVLLNQSLGDSSNLGCKC